MHSTTCLSTLVTIAQALVLLLGLFWAVFGFLSGWSQGVIGAAVQSLPGLATTGVAVWSRWQPVPAGVVCMALGAGLYFFFHRPTGLVLVTLVLPLLLGGVVMIAGGLARGKAG